MELVWTKVLVLALLGALRLAFGLAPLRITRCLSPGSNVEVAVSLCLSFGGGVLLATCFIHMIPEVRESLITLQKNGYPAVEGTESFPLAELLVCCGFFLVYVIEEAVHRWFLHVGTKNNNNEKKLPPSVGDIKTQRQCCSTVGGELQKAEEGTATSDKCSCNHEVMGETNNVSTSPKVCVRLPSGRIAPAISQVQLLITQVPSLESGMRDCHSHGMAALETMGGVRGFLVVVALSFHSLFEGLAIGLQPTARDVWYLFLAVAIHACAVLFCVGLELATSGTRHCRLVAYIVVLAVVSPLGVFIGVLVTIHGVETSSPAHTLAVAVLQALAGGTILYVTFFEVLDREKRRQVGWRGVRIFFILLGFFAMVALQVLGGHDHSAHDVHYVSINGSSSDELHDLYHHHDHEH